MSSLRDIVDINDRYLGAHDVRSTARQYEKNIPVQLTTDAGIRKVIARIYPRWQTAQRLRAGRCARIVYLYYRSPLTGRQCADEVGMPYRAFSTLITKIKRVCEGHRMDGRGPYRRKRREK